MGRNVQRKLDEFRECEVITNGKQFVDCQGKSDESCLCGNFNLC